MMRWQWLAGVMAAGAMLGGCGRTDEPPASFPETLGGAATPISPGIIDLGILRDQTAYQPAAVPGLPAADTTSESSASTGGSVEDDVIRSMVSGAVTGLLNRDVEPLFAAFDETQIAPALAHKSTVLEIIEKMELLDRVTKEKATPEYAAQLAEQQKAFEQLAAALPTALSSALRPQVLSESQALLGVDAGALMSSLGPVLSSLAALSPEGFGGLPGLPASDAGAAPSPEEGAEGEAGAAQEAIAAVQVPLTKSGDAWKIALPRALNDKEGELLGEGLALLRDALDDMVRRTQEIESIGPAESQGLATAVMLDVMTKGAEWWQRVDEYMTTLAADVGAPEPQTPSEAEPTETEPQPRNPRVVPSP